MADTFPRQQARTRHFTLGAPRDFKVAADGSRVAFLRSAAGDDPRTALWVLEDGEERLVATPDGAERLTAQERDRRERAREAAEGITSYDIDERATIASFAVSGRLFVADMAGGGVSELEVPGAVYDARPDPTGRRIAFCCDGAVWVSEDGSARELVGEPGVTWGLAEFVASEEMGRHYGYRWAPDGEALLVARVDESPVGEWWIADAVDPGAEPRAVRYPAAGTANAEVSLHVVTLDGRRRAIPLPEPYLASFAWDDHGPLVVALSRDQRRLVTVDDAGAVVGEQRDDAWVELAPGAPARLDDGRLVTVDHGELKVDGAAVAPGLVTRAVTHVDDGIVFTASTDPTEVHLHRWSPDGVETLTTGPGVHGGHRVVARRSLDRHGAVHTFGPHTFASHAEAPQLVPAPRLLTLGERQLEVAVLLPTGHSPGAKLPVLVDPYGGPHHQRVVKARGAYDEAQWLADQGFAVVIADGRGTPGRDRAFTTAVHGDLAGPPLEDQVDALHATAALVPELDLDRVAIRGWSFGGFLAALAVLRRPDVFHAAVAGAPVVDWSLYDTCYTERYLGTDADAYAQSSPIGEAAVLSRPLMIIHGLVDDNVVAAHSLRFSRALTEAGRPHTFLPLIGVTHMTPQEAVAENVLLLQVDFLKRALAR